MVSTIGYCSQSIRNQRNFVSPKKSCILKKKNEQIIKILLSVEKLRFFLWKRRLFSVQGRLCPQQKESKKNERCLLCKNTFQASVKQLEILNTPNLKIGNIFHPYFYEQQETDPILSANISSLKCTLSYVFLKLCQPTFLKFCQTPFQMYVESRSNQLVVLLTNSKVRLKRCQIVIAKETVNTMESPQIGKTTKLPYPRMLHYNFS